MGGGVEQDGAWGGGSGVDLDFERGVMRLGRSGGGGEADGKVERTRPQVNTTTVTTTAITTTTTTDHIHHPPQKRRPVILFEIIVRFFTPQRVF